MDINQITYILKRIISKKLFSNPREIAHMLEGFLILRQKIRNHDHHKKYFHKLNLILRKIPKQVLKEVAMIIFHDINDNENFRIEFAFLDYPRLMKAFSKNFGDTLPSSFLSKLDSVVKFKFLNIYFPNWMDLLPNCSYLNPKVISKEFTKYLLEKMEDETFFENHWNLLHSLMSRFPKMLHDFLLKIYDEVTSSLPICCLNFDSVLYCTEFKIKYILDDCHLY
jgi:hypothetical protein